MKKIMLPIIVQDKIIESHLFWSNKRFLFNTLVGIASLIGIYIVWLIALGSFETMIFVFYGSIMWGITANGIYSLCFIIDSLIIEKTNGLKSLAKYQLVLFWILTLSYSSLSIYFVLIIFFPIPDAYFIF